MFGLHAVNGVEKMLQQLEPEQQQKATKSVYFGTAQKMKDVT